ncbi:uridine kinase [Candidatus Poribacteria bacterium]|nr:uridine kinase [Candidatus Poribacteria bacterium]
MDNLSVIENNIQTLSETNKVVVIGIAGGSCSGKNYISNILAKTFNGKILSIDDYYRGIEYVKDENFDSPDALELGLLKEHIIQLRKGQDIEKPVYDFKLQARGGYEVFKPADIMIVEGLFALYDMLYEVIDLRIFVEADTKTRLDRRLDRDVRERGRTIESVIKQFEETVEPMHKKYVEPCKEKADYIIINNSAI